MSRCVCLLGWGEQIDLRKHAFHFGTLVKDEYILEPQYKGYEDIVYNLFNITTQQSFKWKFDKGTQVLLVFLSFSSVCVCVCGGGDGERERRVSFCSPFSLMLELKALNVNIFVLWPTTGTP